MTAVKISIIIIYGDVENTINDFVVSLENQTFKEFEAVFVNCNSNEDSIKKVSELTKNVENFHILTLPYNNDYDFAKNSALGVSSGNYVYFIDDDLVKVYNDRFGVKKLVEYTELNFNNEINFNVYAIEW